MAGLSVHPCGIPLLRPLARIWAASVLSMERVSFRQTDEGARCFLGVPGRAEDTEELLNDLSHVEEQDTALREGDGISGDPWLEGVQRVSWGGT